MSTYRLAPFSADVTPPVGHPLLAGQRSPARKIVDPLEAHGFVLLGAGEPIVLAAVDWCEIRNQAYEDWRSALADAAGTVPGRVMISSVHQHDAPVVDTGAGALLETVGLGGAMFDPAFCERTVERVAAAVRGSLRRTRPITHVGTGQAKMRRVASNRRVVLPDGRVSFGRSSASGGEPVYRDAPDGLIDPWLKTLSFWDGDKPVLALHAYATHPMSHYGEGGVSADFVGMARRQRSAEKPVVKQIYVCGCSGDVTAGKYNDGSPANRQVLADRLWSAMREAWLATLRRPIERLDYRVARLSLELRSTGGYTAEALTATLREAGADTSARILAAMGLSSRERVRSGRETELPCLDFGGAQIVLFPGESFVAYQLMAQDLRPDSFVVCIGYGECWPGYIPTDEAFGEGFEDRWLWVEPGAEQRIRAALQRVLAAGPLE